MKQLIFDNTWYPCTKRRHWWLPRRQRDESMMWSWRQQTLQVAHLRMPEFDLSLEDVRPMTSSLDVVSMYSADVILCYWSSLRSVHSTFRLAIYLAHAEWRRSFCGHHRISIWTSSSVPQSQHCVIEQNIVLVVLGYNCTRFLVHIMPTHVPKHCKRHCTRFMTSYIEYYTGLRLR